MVKRVFAGRDRNGWLMQLVARQSGQSARRGASQLDRGVLASTEHVAEHELLKLAVHCTR